MGTISPTGAHQSRTAADGRSMRAGTTPAPQTPAPPPQQPPATPTPCTPAAALPAALDPRPRSPVPDTHKRPDTRETTTPPDTPDVSPARASHKFARKDCPASVKGP